MCLRAFKRRWEAPVHHLLLPWQTKTGGQSGHRSLVDCTPCATSLWELLSVFDMNSIKFCRRTKTHWFCSFIFDYTLNQYSLIAKVETSFHCKVQQRLAVLGVRPAGVNRCHPSHKAIMSQVRCNGGRWWWNRLNPDFQVGVCFGVLLVGVVGSTGEEAGREGLSTWRVLAQCGLLPFAGHHW